jgi:alpha-D-ribose 1-methylphosphonate 5-triphosphate synthase subunit PhnL
MNQDLDLKAKVKQILKVVQELAPGRSVELRIPPYAAIQCVEGGNHRRGTPPNVVEMKAETLINLLEIPEQWHLFRLQAQTQIWVNYLSK